MPRPKKVVVENMPQITSENQGYCRICKKMLPANKFYQATNPMIDKNNLMSICIDHCKEIYNSYFTIYNNIDEALQLTCESLDVCFNKQALKETKSHIEKLVSNGKKAESVFGYYKSKLSSTSKNNDSIEGFRYKDSDFIREQELKNQIEELQLESEETDEDLILFWGKGFNIDDLIFLEAELSNWKKTHKCDNQAEVTLLKEICIKILTIRNKRAENKDGKEISQDVKELQELFKTASVDPAKANAASAGKSHDCYGLWIKDIEQFKPAEWFEQQEKYADMDGFKPYIKNYIVRPIENFLSGVRNFFVNDNIDADLDSVDVGNNDGGEING